MNFLDAMNKMLNGEKVRCISWNKGEYLTLNKNGKMVDEDGTKYSFAFSKRRDFEVCLSDTWELYKAEENNENKEVPEEVARFLKLIDVLLGQ